MAVSVLNPIALIMAGNCIECGEKLFGRADKKYCSAYCRNTHFNRLNSNATKMIRNINSILRRNRRILSTFKNNGKARVHKSKLINKGFKFDYITNTYTTKSGNQYFFCYDYGYVPVDGEYYSVVIRQSYVDE